MVRGVNIVSYQNPTTLDSKATFLTDLDKVLTQGLHELTEYKDMLQMLYIYIQITKIMS